MAVCRLALCMEHSHSRLSQTAGSTGRRVGGSGNPLHNTYYLLGVK